MITLVYIVKYSQPQKTYHVPDVYWYRNIFSFIGYLLVLIALIFFLVLTYLIYHIDNYFVVICKTMCWHFIPEAPCLLETMCFVSLHRGLHWHVTLHVGRTIFVIIVSSWCPWDMYGISTSYTFWYVTAENTWSGSSRVSNAEVDKRLKVSFCWLAQFMCCKVAYETCCWCFDKGGCFIDVETSLLFSVVFERFSNYAPR